MTSKKTTAVTTTQEFFGGKLWYTRDSGEVTVGLTSAALEEIGSVQSVDFPESSGSVEEGDVIAIIEGERDTIEVTAPLSGYLFEVNSTVEDEPGTITDDPLEEGWLCRIEPEDFEESEDEDSDDEDLDEDEDEDLDEEDEDDSDDEDLDDEDEEEDDEEDR